MNCNSCKGRGEDLSTAFKEQLWESFLWNISMVKYLTYWEYVK